VLTPAGLILVEIKSRPGTVQGDPHTWTWTTDGRLISDDNPLLLANRKAKRLASVLRRQDAFGRGKARVPWVEPAIFLSGVRAEPRLDPGSTQKVFRRGDPRSPSDRGIIGALTGISGTELGRRGSVDSNVARATHRAVEQAGIRPRLRSRRVGDYELGEQLGEGEGWQDFLAKHVSLGVARRVRIYPFTRAASPEERKRLGRMAAREFRVLEGIDHPGILRVLHFEESELGPALVFEHDPAAMRLDQLLAQHLQDRTLEARLDLLRQLAVGLGYAHGKRLYHQGLTPQNILVRDPASDRPRVQIMNWQVAIRGEGNTSISAMTMGTGNLDDHFADLAKVYLAPESLGAHTESGPRADVFSLGAIAYHLDRVGELLLPRRPAGDETSEDRALANYLGIEGVIAWPTPGDVAKACEIPRSVVATALEQARDRWHRAHELNELRTDITALLQGAGGVATVDELAGQLLAARGSVEEDEGDRGRLARAALRAAVELEASVEPIRFGANAEGEPVLLATHPDLADHARRLGQAADRLAVSDPLPNPNRAQEELAAVPVSTAVTPPPTQRLLRLAVAASRTAALSARLELYPRGEELIDRELVELARLLDANPASSSRRNLPRTTWPSYSGASSNEVTATSALTRAVVGPGATRALRRSGYRRRESAPMTLGPRRRSLPRFG
jgi:serine/threonine protein kinase